MRNLLIGASLIGAFLAVSNVPASAQYAFDRRIDPSNCSWRDYCDYGGRAIRGIRIVHHRRSECSEIVEQRPRPDGVLVAVRTRKCGAVLRVRG